MKKKRFFIALPLSVLLLAGVIYLASWYFDFTIDLPFMKRQTISASRQVLTGARDLMELATVEYLYKTVFPYDLVPPDTDFRDLFGRSFRGEILSREEEELIELYRLCAGIGIDLSMEQYRFAVISVRVRGGYDFQDRVLHLEEEAGSKQQKPGIIVTLPEAVITDLVIVDEVREEYPYPDIDASPAQWKVVSALVEESTRRQVLEDGILEEAEKRGKAYLQAVLKQAGYERISFRTYASNLP